MEGEVYIYIKRMLSVFFSGEMQKLFFTKLSFEEFEISFTADRSDWLVFMFGKQLSSEVVEEFSGKFCTL